MIRLQESYDWITLGDHPASLLSACIAARLGLSVLVLSLRPTRGTVIHKSGTVLDFEPNYFLGLQSDSKVKGLLHLCLSKVGISASELEAVQFENSMPTIITPTQRVVLSTTGDLFFKEMRREFGQELLDRMGFNGALKLAEKDFIKYWADLPERHTLKILQKGEKRKPEPLIRLNDILKLKRSDKSNLSSAQKNWFKRNKSVFDLERKLSTIPNVDLTNFFQGVCHGLLNGSNREDLRLSEIIHAMGLLKTGASFQGGVSSLRELLLRMAKRLGAHVPSKTYCRRVFVENGQFIGVQVSEQSEMIRGKTAILGSSLNQVAEKITWSGRSWLRKLKVAPTPNAWRFTLSLLVNKNAIPMGVSRRCYYQEKNAPILEVEIVEPKDYGENFSDQSIIFLRTLMPFDLESLSYEYQRVIAGRMLRKLLEIFPFLEFHIQKIYPDFRMFSGYTDPYTSVFSKDGITNELSEVYGFATPELIPDHLRCFKGAGVGSRSGLESLYVATDESYPELGSLGGVVAAIEAVSAAAHRFGLSGPFVG